MALSEEAYQNWLKNQQGSSTTATAEQKPGLLRQIAGAVADIPEVVGTVARSVGDLPYMFDYAFRTDGANKDLAFGTKLQNWANDVPVLSTFFNEKDQDPTQGRFTDAFNIATLVATPTKALKFLGPVGEKVAGKIGLDLAEQGVNKAAFNPSQSFVRGLLFEGGGKGIANEAANLGGQALTGGAFGSASSVFGAFDENRTPTFNDVTEGFKTGALLTPFTSLGLRAAGNAPRAIRDAFTTERAPILDQSPNRYEVQPSVQEGKPFVDPAEVRPDSKLEAQARSAQKDIVKSQEYLENNKASLEPAASVLDKSVEQVDKKLNQDIVNKGVEIDAIPKVRQQAPETGYQFFENPEIAKTPRTYNVFDAATQTYKQVKGYATKVADGIDTFIAKGEDGKYSTYETKTGLSVDPNTYPNKTTAASEGKYAIQSNVEKFDQAINNHIDTNGPAPQLDPAIKQKAELATMVEQQSKGAGTLLRDAITEHAAVRDLLDQARTYKGKISDLISQSSLSDSTKSFLLGPSKSVGAMKLRRNMEDFVSAKGFRTQVENIVGKRPDFERIVKARDSYIAQQRANRASAEVVGTMVKQGENLSALQRRRLERAQQISQTAEDTINTTNQNLAEASQASLDLFKAADTGELTGADLVNAHNKIQSTLDAEAQKLFVKTGKAGFHAETFKSLFNLGNSKLAKFSMYGDTFDVTPLRNAIDTANKILYKSELRLRDEGGTLTGQRSAKAVREEIFNTFADANYHIEFDADGKVAFIAEKTYEHGQIDKNPFAFEQAITSGSRQLKPGVARVLRSTPFLGEALVRMGEGGTTMFQKQLVGMHGDIALRSVKVKDYFMRANKAFAKLLDESNQTGKDYARAQAEVSHYYNAQKIVSEKQLMEAAGEKNVNSRLADMALASSESIPPVDGKAFVDWAEGKSDEAILQQYVDSAPKELSQAQTNLASELRLYYDEMHRLYSVQRMMSGQGPLGYVDHYISNYVDITKEGGSNSARLSADKLTTDLEKDTASSAGREYVGKISRKELKTAIEQRRTNKLNTATDLYGTLQMYHNKTYQTMLFKNHYHELGVARKMQDLYSTAKNKESVVYALDQARKNISFSDRANQNNLLLQLNNVVSRSILASHAPTVMFKQFMSITSALADTDSRSMIEAITNVMRGKDERSVVLQARDASSIGVKGAYDKFRLEKGADIKKTAENFLSLAQSPFFGLIQWGDDGAARIVREMYRLSGEKSGMKGKELAQFADNSTVNLMGSGNRALDPAAIRNSNAFMKLFYPFARFSTAEFGRLLGAGARRQERGLNKGIVRAYAHAAVLNGVGIIAFTALYNGLFKKNSPVFSPISQIPFAEDAYNIVTGQSTGPHAPLFDAFKDISKGVTKIQKGDTAEGAQYIFGHSLPSYIFGAQILSNSLSAATKILGPDNGDLTDAKGNYAGSLREGNLVQQAQNTLSYIASGESSYTYAQKEAAKRALDGAPDDILGKVQYYSDFGNMLGNIRAGMDQLGKFIFPPVKAEGNQEVPINQGLVASTLSPDTPKDAKIQAAAAAFKDSIVAKGAGGKTMRQSIKEAGNLKIKPSSTKLDKVVKLPYKKSSKGKKVKVAKLKVGKAKKISSPKVKVLKTSKIKGLKFGNKIQ